MSSAKPTSTRPTTPKSEIATLDQLRGRQARLERELADAFGDQPLSAARIDRLVNEIAATEYALAASSAHLSEPPEHLSAPGE